LRRSAPVATRRKVDLGEEGETHVRAPKVDRAVLLREFGAAAAVQADLDAVGGVERWRNGRRGRRGGRRGARRDGAAEGCGCGEEGRAEREREGGAHRAGGAGAVDLGGRGEGWRMRRLVSRCRGEDGETRCRCRNVGEVRGSERGVPRGTGGGAREGASGRGGGGRGCGTASGSEGKGGKGGETEKKVARFEAAAMRSARCSKS